MDPAVWGFIGVVIGGLVTGVVTLLAAKVQADAAASLDSAKRRDDRQLERDAFQRENLLELQDALNRWIRAVNALHAADRRSLRETGSPVSLFPDGLSEAEFDSGRRLMYLTERVVDDDLRSRLRALRELVGTQFVHRAVRSDRFTASALNDAAEALADDATDAQERLGDVLRRYL